MVQERLDELECIVPANAIITQLTPEVGITPTGRLYGKQILRAEDSLAELKSNYKLYLEQSK